MNKLQLTILLWLGILVQGLIQTSINQPVNFKDSLKITKIIEYRVDNFVCTDTIKTINEIDAIGRRKKNNAILSESVTKRNDLFRK